MMFSFMQTNEVYNTPPRLQQKEKDETYVNKYQDCVSFCRDSGHQFIFEVQPYKKKNENEEFYIYKDPLFQSRIQKDIDEKTKGIKTVLGRLGTSLDRLRSKVDSMINPSNPMRDIFMSKIQSKVQSKLSQVMESNIDKENQESHITTVVFPPPPPLNIIYGSKHIERSCTKSCSKIKSQIKKYQNNKEFQSFKNLLKEIKFSESSKKNSMEDQLITIKPQNDYEQLNARRKLDFDSIEEDDIYNDMDTPKSYSLNQNSKIVDDNCDSDTVDDNYDVGSKKKKIFVKDIQRDNQSVNYNFIYRTHH